MILPLSGERDPIIVAQEAVDTYDYWMARIREKEERIRELEWRVFQLEHPTAAKRIEHLI